jgi:hypothetical protein
MKKAYVFIGILLAGITTTLLLAEDEKEDEREGDREDGNREKREHVDGELREWLEKQKHKIESLKKRGRIEEAAHLISETRKVMAEKMRHRSETNEHSGHQHAERVERDHGEVDELQLWAKQRERKIHELAESGQHEEARELQAETRRIVEEKLSHRSNQERERHNRVQVEHRERNEGEGKRFEGWVDEQKRRIHDLRENNRREEAQRLEHELAEKIEHYHHEHEREQRDREHHEGDRHMEDKLKHLMVAIEHLHAAGMHDIAEEVERRAHGDHNRRDHQENNRDHGNNEVNQLRGEVDELRRALHEMREVVGRLHEGRENRR